MTRENKRVYMLLKTVIFNYHGLDDIEKQDLKRSASLYDAYDEMAWANEFVALDYLTAFDRARVYLHDIIGDYPREKRVELINMVWDSNNLKGYITEMEATAMLKLARDWHVEKELMELVME